MEVVLTWDPAMILLPSTESRFGMELDLDRARDLEAALDLDLLERVPNSSW